jgi:transposase
MGWRRGQAYAQDLRDRVLAAVGEPIRAVAARFGVSPSYVSKVHSRCRKTGETTPGPQHNHVAPRLAPLYDALRARVAEQADATIAELRAWVRREHGIAVSHPVMWKTLARLGLTLKKTLTCGRTGPRRCRRSTRRMGRADARTGRDQAGFYR